MNTSAFLRYKDLGSGHVELSVIQLTLIVIVQSPVRAYCHRDSETFIVIIGTLDP